ncbi:MAG: hypothetical protein JRF15_00595 [Deltaproteobacteria bacterium]|jgi:hypothetical protein|nr:hypothetical protein [Deltaproteobacteria bacterium]
MKLPDWKTCVGYLVVLAALALSLPGVQAVRADDSGVVISVDLVDSGSSCELGADSATMRSAQVSLGSGPDPSEGPDPIALNNQGYSYRPPGVDPEARQLEER